LDVSEEELAQRRSEWQPRPARFDRGYGKLFAEEITQANEGCDFRFLHAGTPTPEPAIH
jgi:dihydroxy-acid dehydratase